MVPTRLISTLGASAHRALLPFLSTGAVALRQSKPTREEDFVAALVLGGAPAVATAWTKILKPQGIKLSLRGVFCHGRPQVAYTASSTSCELADLLLVIDDITSGAPAARQAALVQAKMAKGTPTITLRGGDLVQLKLLQSWPVFTFVDKGYSTRARDFNRSVSSAIAKAGGIYGVIDKSHPDWQQIPTPTTSKLSVSGTDLGNYLAGMADGSSRATGRVATAGGKDDWSFTIDELLTITGGRAFTLKSIPGQPKRGLSSQAGLIVSYGSSPVASLAYWLGDFWHGGGGSHDDLPPFAEGSRQGVSSIHIVLEGEGVGRSR